ncbi:MAG: ABC transporter permease [Gammaproteobacteria bacterium]|nr:ABC transporter permease [Gammaproteobacteria bacterium]MCW8839706.1 ABC transporter permease [Gammaproteobacteria bacterium]MCW8927877.1 ABC transporter permease [Gammaproteobacteria bacterium]MCW8959644.1 ABC transporter permease [Gammaproteobacteria bacterium]MCW8972462.1 ABC transporter permease [Gammaproteobacteria bacterium]
MWERVYRMMVKEFLQMLRDRRMKFLIFVTPVIQLIIFGYAATTDVDHIRTAVYDLDRSADSRALVDAFTGSGYFQLNAWLTDEAQVVEQLDRGKVIMVLRIGRGFSEALRSGKTNSVQVLVDGTDSNTGTLAMSYAQRIISEFPARRLELPAQEGVVVLRSRAWYNPDLKSRNFNVPGVMALILMLTSLLLTSMAVVREREIGTLEQLMVTPIRPMELILGKTLPFVVIAYIQLVMVMMVSLYWFEVPMVGNPVILLFGAGLYLMSTLGVGLFISTVSQTQQQALMSSFFFFFPAILLSGFMFPIENMPQAAQWITYFNPLRYFLVVVRDVFLKGNEFLVLWPQFAAQALLGISLLVLSALRFRKRIT